MNFGDFVTDPAQGWRPWMGNLFHIAPKDMIDMTMGQIIEMHDFMRAQNDQ